MGNFTQQQHVKLIDFLGENANNDYGGPQGSVLRPLLYSPRFSMR